MFPCTTRSSVGVPGQFPGLYEAARQAERDHKRVLEEQKNSSEKRLTNRKGYAILPSLKRTPVEPTEQAQRFKCKRYGAYQVRTLTTQEWKAEQQLGDSSSNTTRGVSSSCQFCEQAKQQCFGLDRNLS